MNIAIASGKGGTGKTTIAINLALSLKNTVYLDCDVEEPDGHLFLQPIMEQSQTASRLLPEINYKKCTYCGHCTEICQYHAFTMLPGQVLLFAEMCHSCGACTYYCPEGAISEKKRPMGMVRSGYVAPEGTGFVEGRLNIGEMMAAPLIRQVKAWADPQKINILDAPPGTACSMVEVVRDADFCLLITQPTPFGLHDLKLAVNVLRILQIWFAVAENKAMDQNELISQYCHSEGIPILQKIPYERRLAEIYSQEKAAVRVFPDLKKKFSMLYRKIELQLQTESPLIVDSVNLSGQLNDMAAKTVDEQMPSRDRQRTSNDG